MIQSYGFACTAANEPMKPWSFERRDLRDDDVRIEITHCGVCHSDIHQARSGRATASASAAWSIPARIAPPAPTGWSSTAKRA